MEASSAVLTVDYSAYGRFSGGLASVACCVRGLSRVCIFYPYCKYCAIIIGFYWDAFLISAVSLVHQGVHGDVELDI
jgi:hypothetical protein